ncbi:hypothetical protein [Microbispora sp. NPDC046933]|uniref:hypothetical protein n=1 Tax=Microbispora sp. NPDC046933 TaxID=3155618 RepID=UPI0033F21A6C
MRTLKNLAAVLTVTAAAISVAAPAQATPAGATQAQNSHAQTAPSIVAYHGLTSAQQTERFNTLSAQGYQPITVSISTDSSGRSRYAAVWSSSGGAMGADLPWAMYQDMSSAGYQRRFDQYTAQGYLPAVVSATGSGADARFAAIFVKRSGVRYIAKHNITPKELDSTNATARKDGLWLTSVDVYGTADAPRYVAVWSSKPGGFGWHVSYALTQEKHNIEFKDATALGAWRPTVITVWPNARYTTVWRDDDKPGSWYSYVGMTAAGYQSRFNELKAKGFYPFQISVENGIYAAIWTK